MITRNFRNLMALMAEASGTVSALLPARDVTGRPLYLHSVFSNQTFPTSRTTTPTVTATSSGISLGTGNSAEKETDYQLEKTLTSGVQMTLTSTTMSVDEYGSPTVTFRITVTNTSGAELTITEVGYKQTVPAVPKLTFTSSSNYVLLLDRTVLKEPLVLSAGDAGVIEYKLTTYPYPHRVIGDVELVSWTWGTNEQIVAMIEAANAGLIDLQKDANWTVGDMRVIDMSGFKDARETVFAPQEIALVITSFEDYNDCGCVMQVDFYDSLTPAERMHSTAQTAGGYSGSEVYTTTIPAVLNALPEWLQDLLKPFSVLVSEGPNSDTIETIEDNKLALRSEVEITGTTNYSKAGEGNQIDFYKSYRYKCLGFKSTSASAYLTRSPYNATQYCSINSSGAATYLNANSTAGLSLFGCL